MIGIIIQLTGVVLLSAQEMDVPVEIQVPLFMKVLTFDRNLEERVGDEIVIAIVYQEKFRKSLNIMLQLENYLNNWEIKRVAGIPFRYISIVLDSYSLPEFKAALEKEHVDVIYITPLRAVTVESLVAVSRPLGITSLSGVSAYCREGIAVSISTKGGSPVIVINRSVAISEGADFSSRLLKLAEIIK